MTFLYEDHVPHDQQAPFMTDILICEELGISTRQLRRWRDEFRLLGDDAFPG